jgi:hypothetical protein
MKEDKIEVGEYVRTDKGKVGKVIEKRLGDHRTTGTVINMYDLDTGLWTTDFFIVKHSKNIIDLIKERRLCKWRRNHPSEIRLAYK